MGAGDGGQVNECNERLVERNDSPLTHVEQEKEKKEKEEKEEKEKKGEGAHR